MAAATDATVTRAAFGGNVTVYMHNLILPTYGYACYETQAAGSRRPSSPSRGRKLRSRFWEPMASSARGVSPDICIDMSEQDNIDRVWVCMLTTQFAGGLRARKARPRRWPDLFRDRRSQCKGGLDRSRVRCRRPCLHRSERQSLPVDHRSRPRYARCRQDERVLEKDRRVLVAGSTDSDVCLIRIEPLTADRRALQLPPSSSPRRS
jgi:hypothetical protein